MARYSYESDVFFPAPALAPASGFDSATLAWVAQVIINGGTVSTPRKTIVDNLIVGLKAASLFDTRLDRFFLFAAENEPSALTSIVNPTTTAAVNNGSIAFQIDRGYTSAASAQYVDTNFNASTAPSPKYSFHDSTLFGWCNTAAVSDINHGMLMSLNGGANPELHAIVSCLASAIWQSFDNAGFNCAGVVDSTIGFFQGVNDSGGNQVGYRNGALVASSAVNSGPNMSGNLISHNSGGTHLGLLQSCCMGCGNAFNATEAASFYNLVLTYMAAVFTQAWVDQVVTDGGTVSAGRQTIVNTLVVGLMTDGIWYKLDRLWLFAAENSQSALRDIIGNNQATAVNSPTFTTDRGYTGADSSTTVYIDTGFNPSTGGFNYTRDVAHLSTWSVTGTPSGATGGVNVGCLGGGVNYQSISIRGFAANTNFLSLNTTVNESYIDTVGTGHFLGSRQTNLIVDFYNNAMNKNGRVDDASVALNNLNFFALALNNAGLAIYGSAQQSAMISFGGYLSPSEVTAFYNRLRTYMTAVGVP